jgi:hypothetical protein
MQRSRSPLPPPRSGDRAGGGLERVGADLLSSILYAGACGLFVTGVVACFVPFVEMGYQRGEVGDNRYGPDPAG